MCIRDRANSVLISVDNNDPVRGMALQERLADEVNKLLQTDSFRGAVLSQTVVKSDELQQMAEQYGITLGKAQLIQEILGKNSLHTFDELAPLSINELNILLGKEGAETHVEVVGTASEKGDVYKRQLLDSWGALQSIWIQVVVITLISTVIVMGVSGSITQFVIRKGKKKEE